MRRRSPGRTTGSARAVGRRRTISSSTFRSTSAASRSSPFAHERGALYLDTVIEPWGGVYFDRNLSPAARSNYALREQLLRLRRELGRGPTAVSSQGANPGLVSQLVKEAALIVARDTGLPHAEPTDRTGWARLFRDLGVKVDPHRRARHPGLEPPQASGRVRQYLVDRRLRLRGLPARRAGLGHARASLPQGRHAPCQRLWRGDLPDPARRGDARAHLDAATMVLSTAFWSRTTSRSRWRTT